MFKTRYAIHPISASVSSENYAFMALNHCIADYFGGNYYQYIHDLTTDTAAIAKMKSLISYFFPHNQVQLVYRKADLVDYRNKAIELVRKGKAVVYTHGADTNMSMSEEEQAYLARQDMDMGIRLTNVPDIVMRIDDLITGHEEYKFCADHTPMSLFYPQGNPNSVFCNVVDDDTIEITHVFREKRYLDVSAYEILMHSVMETPPPFYGHIDISSCQIDSTLIWDHMINDLPPQILNNVIINYLTTSKPTVTCDFSFIKKRETSRIGKKELHEEITRWFPNADKVGKLRILQSLLPMEDAANLSIVAKHFYPTITWKIEDIQSYVDEFINGPTYLLSEMPNASEMKNIHGLSLSLQMVKFNVDEISQTVLENAVMLCTHVSVLDKILFYAILGRRRPVAIYNMMVDIGKEECLRRIEKLERIAVRERQAQSNVM